MSTPYAPVRAARADGPLDRVGLLRTMLSVRAVDLREEKLLRQGRGWIHIPGLGHEPLGLVLRLLLCGDVGRVLDDLERFAVHVENRVVACLNPDFSPALADAQVFASGVAAL